MDPGGLFSVAFLFGFVCLCVYGIYRNLSEDWRQVRGQEKKLKWGRMGEKAEQLQQRAAAQEQALADSSRKLEQTVEELDRVDEVHGRRLENLETVVVGQVWKALEPVHEAPEPSADGQSPPPGRPVRESGPDPRY